MTSFLRKKYPQDNHHPSRTSFLITLISTTTSYYGNTMTNHLDTVDINDDEDFPSNSTRPTSSSASIVLDDDNAEEGEDEYDPTTPSIQRQRRKSIIQSKGRRRRRSSARFLRLVSNGENDQDLLEGTLSSTLTTGGNGGPSSSSTSAANLGEVYQKAIRMNAENRINAANSWNLSLIDHLDRFIAHDIGDGAGAATNHSGGRSFSSNMDESLTTASLATGINFTKASCTLDASVKIYSYRVDDVHLSSYRVLANLNRTDNGKANNNNNSSATAAAAASASANASIADGNDGGGGDGVTGSGSRSSNKAAAATETLEHNLGTVVFRVSLPLVALWVSLCM